MDRIKAVEIEAELRQIKTMVDGSANITLNVPENCIEQVKVMFGWMRDHLRLVIEHDSTNGDDGW